MAFWGNIDGAKHLGYIVIRAPPHRKVFDERYDWAWRSPKTVKIEGYKSRFQTSTGPVHRMSWDGSSGHGMLY